VGGNGQEGMPEEAVSREEGDVLVVRWYGGSSGMTWCVGTAMPGGPAIAASG